MSGEMLPPGETGQDAQIWKAIQEFVDENTETGEESIKHFVSGSLQGAKLAIPLAVVMGLGASSFVDKPEGKIFSFLIAGFGVLSSGAFVGGVTTLRETHDKEKMLESMREKIALKLVDKK